MDWIYSLACRFFLQTRSLDRSTVCVLHICVMIGGGEKERNGFAVFEAEKDVFLARIRSEGRLLLICLENLEEGERDSIFVLVDLIESKLLRLKLGEISAEIGEDR